MTSFRQMQANRCNALKSTGPTTAEGKQQSRRNAMRHGLTAETLIGTLEDAEDYRGFEAAVTADYDAQSAVERELVLRLASALWRLRRATAIETGLFEMQAHQLREHAHQIMHGSSMTPSSGRPDIDPDLGLANCFLRLANLPHYPLDRLSRYEAALWRQAAQILLTLNAIRWKLPPARRRPQYLDRIRNLPIE